MSMKFFPVAALAALVGCSSDPGKVGGGGGGINGGGGGVTIKLDASPGSGGTGGRGGTSTLPPGTLNMVVRDFRFWNGDATTTNPDFENVPKTDKDGNPCEPNDPKAGCYGDWDDRDTIVADKLGDDFKPVYRTPGGTTLTTHGEEYFHDWYHTVDGKNIMQEIPLTLSKMPDGSYQYDSRNAGPPLSPNGSFFPIDDGTQYQTAFGNEGKEHNYSFTVEIHTLFTYNGGENFFFSGDDDVFVFINNQLVLDRGGIHGREDKNVLLDEQAAKLGLTKGQSGIPLDFFYAERHVVDSNLKITTTLDLSNNGEIPIF
jgi:fibro-slime domain-containing protein